MSILTGSYIRQNPCIDGHINYIKNTNDSNNSNNNNINIINTLYTKTSILIINKKFQGTKC